MANELTPVPIRESDTALPALLDFDPVALHHRIDGWTVERQRNFLEALADSGIIRHAAAAVGMSEQSVTRLRRRAGAQAFDLACDAALRIGARRLRTIAFERAVEGQIKRHYYRGELVGEELVHDNRLLICLLGKHQHLFSDPVAVTKAAREWDNHLATLVDGESLAAEDHGPGVVIQPLGVPRKGGEDIWREKNGKWRTRLPPPDGFDGDEERAPGHELYRRDLSAEEEVAVEARMTAQLDAEAARRDTIFAKSPRSMPRPSLAISPRT